MSDHDSPVDDGQQVRFHDYAGPDAVDARMVWRCPTYDYPHTCSAPAMHITMLEGPDSAGQWGWRCTTARCGVERSGYRPEDVVSAAVNHGDLAADTATPPGQPTRSSTRMSVYSAEIGTEAIEALCDPRGALGAISHHVYSEEDAVAAGFSTGTMVFDGRVLQALRDLSPDDDGSITEAGEEDGTYYPMQVWIGGVGHPITTAQS